MPIPPIVDSLRAAWNAHDLVALAACLQTDAISEHPAHPERDASAVTRSAAAGRRRVRLCLT